VANPKGEVTVKIDGETFTLVYDFNALCAIEEQLELDVAEMGEAIQSPSKMRSVFRIGLQAKHGSMTDLEAGNLIYRLGIREAAEAVGQAFQAAFPDPSADTGGNGTTTKKIGTGRKP
jgi:hypothetical protein